MVPPHRPKILSNRLKAAAEDFRYPATVRCACWRRRLQIQKRLNARHGCRPRSRVRHEGCGRMMQVLPEPFVVAEEKRLVLLDRPSRGSTKLVPLKRRSGTLVEEIRRIQRVVAQILERRSMPLIRSRSRHNHDLAARPFAEFPSVRVALHVEFAHCVHAQHLPALPSALKLILATPRNLHSVHTNMISRR